MTVAVHPAGVVKVMLAVPGVVPVRSPVDVPMDATAVLALVQVPPGVGSVKVAVFPVHKEAGPVIMPNGLTVTVAEVKQPPGAV